MAKRCTWRKVIALSVAVLLHSASGAAAVDWQQAGDDAIERLRAYIRVNTTNPPGNETPAAELLRDWLAAEGIETRLYDAMNNPARQALVARLPGSGNRSIVLMSHSDVVPAIADEWSHPPFAADVADGVLYGRGALDTKGLGVLQAMTLILLHRQGRTPRDTLLLLIEPDEEDTGQGVQGMLAKYPELFQNVRLVLNEGGSGLRGLIGGDATVFFVQTAEKGVAWMKLTARGDTGHGSVPLPNNAVATMARALDRIAAYQTPLRPPRPVAELFATLASRQSFPDSFVMRHVDNALVQRLFRRQLTERPLINAMLRTTISLTGVHGGYKTNVIPAQVEATLDCRVTIGDSGEALKHELERVVDDPRVTIALMQDGTPNESPVDEGLMSAVRETTGRHVAGSLVAPFMSSGVTDSAYFRRRGVPAYGLNPVVLTEAEVASMHGKDERVRLDQLRSALRMYYEIVTRLAGVEAPDGQ